MPNVDIEGPFAIWWNSPTLSTFRSILRDFDGNRERLEKMAEDACLIAYCTGGIEALAYAEGENAPE